MLKRRLLPGLFGLLIVLALVGLRAADPYPVQVVREIAFDLYQRLKPREIPVDPPVRVIDVDEASLTSIGQWPWSRDQLATLVDRLTEMGAAAIVFDMLFPEPDRMSPQRLAAQLPGVDAATLPDYDALFAAALAGGPSILGFSRIPDGPALRNLPKSGFAVSGSDPRPALPEIEAATTPLRALYDGARGFGVVSLNTTDAVSAVRRLPLVWTTQNEFYPTLSIEALRVAQSAETIVLLGETSGGGDYPVGVRVGQFDVPTTSEGNLWLYYHRPYPELYVSARDVLGFAYQRHADKIAGHIVLIGTSASGLLDLHTTTLGDNVPGVSIHAQAIDQIFSGQFLTRAHWVEGLELLGFAALGILTVLVTLNLGPLAGLLAGAAVMVGTGWFSWHMFATQGLMIDPSFPLFGIALVYAAMVFFQFSITDADKRQIRRAFGYYVAPALLTEIERNGDRLKLGGEMRPITVLFTDVRGFTPLSERVEPQRMLTILNTMFGALGKQIVEQLGTIDKFVGDAIMAFWNAPVDIDDHARRACIATLGMRRTLAELNAANAFGLKGSEAGIDELVIGMGIATGEALVGNMGLETRFDYSAVGNTVNVASRVETASKEVGYDIVVVNATRDAVPDFAFLEAGSLVLKGKSQREPIHLLVGDATLAESGGFKLLRMSHIETLKLLRDGQDATGGIAECKVLAAKVEPGLVCFYERLASRRADFAQA
jgi:adenylate cyclase